jgi:putative heme-binding domain-containing protein
LATSEYDALPVAVNLAMNDRAEEVRGAAISLIPSLDMEVEEYTTLIDPIFSRGSLREQQELLNVLADLPSEVADPIVGSLTEKMLAGELNPSLRLDIQEVVERTGNQELLAQLAALSSDDPNSVASFQETLYGGDARKGWQVLNEHPAAQCLRCHSFEPDETTVGPSLGGIANKLTREQLLEALIEPSARIAPGYGTVMLTLSDGQNVSGVLMEETAEELVLKTSEAEPLHIPTARISDRRNAPSGMPPMGTLLTRREIRDLVELLSRMD